MFSGVRNASGRRERDREDVGSSAEEIPFGLVETAEGNFSEWRFSLREKDEGALASKLAKAAPARWNIFYLNGGSKVDFKRLRRASERVREGGRRSRRGALPLGGWRTCKIPKY